MTNPLTAAGANKTAKNGEPPAAIAVGALGLVVAAAAAPGLIPLCIGFAIGNRGYAASKHRRFWLWLTPERWPLMVASGLSFALVVGFTVSAMVRMTHNAAPVELWSWLVASAAVGAVGAPGAFLIGRRLLRRELIEGRARDVLVNAQSIVAMTEADDEQVARSVGVSLNEDTVGLSVVDPVRVMTAPIPVEIGKDVRYGVGILMPDDSMTDRRRSAQFTAANCDLLLVPASAGQQRIQVFAGSGVGKTEFLAGIHAAQNRMGMTTVLIDLKGIAEDAERFAADARAQRDYVGAEQLVRVERGGWDFFDTTRDELLDRLMFIAPKTQSTDYYTKRLRRVLDIIIDGRGTKPLVKSLDELTERLADPVAHLGAQLAGPITEADRHGDTEAKSVAQDVEAMFAPLRRLLPKTGEGWSFTKLPQGSATIVSLLPVRPAERLLANLMLRDLRELLAQRSEQSKAGTTLHPLAVTIDEFPQMVEPETDAADEAVRIFETARAADVGLILAGQTVEGFSLDKEMQRRMLGAGTAVVLGRSALPDTVTESAGTRVQLEAAGDPYGHGINSARAQHTFAVSPQQVRQLHTGLFYLVHEGAVARFMAFRTI
ncbi:hypothetical protein D7D52_34885 [Nocardia yunnanensis]|uniref:Uncharacterized protein n=1 Tax=Nocardia yunnanensis TaxID=2382165 RepID=A0A386ZL61_9NOCA|nr:hypothetical protein [Nocardia yunnanensis]AYF78158.1 hypothetical protein D7D52_34885 [Nocardia yunnanensis]